MSVNASPVLNSTQRKRLRGLAHGLRPVVHVGSQGITDALLRSLGEALDSHELIKLKFVDFKDQKKELAAELAERSGSTMVGLIGNVGIYYREHPEPDQRKVDPGE